MISNIALYSVAMQMKRQLTFRTPFLLRPPHLSGLRNRPGSNEDRRALLDRAQALLKGAGRLGKLVGGSSLLIHLLIS